MSSDFTYLKTWLDHPNPRPVVLECQVSRSGLSMSVYERDRLFCRVNGCGFDRYGCALAEFLHGCFTPELKELAASGYEASRHVAGSAFTAVNMAQAWEAPDWRVSLNGGCGIQSMSAIAEALGLTVQVHETRSSTLLIIQKKGN